MRKYFLFNSNLHSDGKIFVAGPAVGAPMAVLNLEKLIALGAETIILYGWCGSLSPNLRGMDLFIPTRAISEEGTSNHYKRPEGRVIEPDARCFARLCEWVKSCGEPWESGPIWTTDAPYRETYYAVEKYQGEGVMAVDMEYSALCTVATYRGVRLAALMFVSDELWHKPWKPLFNHKLFRRKSGEILAGLYRFLENSTVI